MEDSNSGLGLRKLFENASLTFVRQGVAVVFGLGLAILVARILGPEGNGQYTLAILLPMLLSTLLNMGVAPANIYFVGRGSVSVDTALASSIRFWLILSLLGLTLAAAIVLAGRETLLPGVPPLILLLGVVGFPLTLLQALLNSLLLGMQDFVRYNKAALATPIVALLSAVVTVWLVRGGVVGAVAAFVMGAGAGAAYTYRLLAPYRGGEEPEDVDEELSRSYARSCIGYGWKVHLSNILAFLQYRADIYLLNLLIAPAAVGLYAVAVQIGERVWMLSGSVSTVLLPRLSEMWREESARRDLTPLVARWVFLASLAGGLVLAILAPWFIDLLFGEEYLESASALRWLIPGIVLGSMSKVLANDLAARGRPELNLYTSVVVVALNIGANIVLIPQYGIVGAAAATSLSYGVNTLLKLWLYSWVSTNAWWRPVVLRRTDLLLLRKAVRSVLP